MGSFISRWPFDPLIILMTITLVCLYYKVSGGTPVKYRISFWSAIVVILFATCSPLHYLGMHVYFSAHMISHVLLLLIAGPLLVISLDPNGPAVGLKALNALSSFLHGRSWLAWLAGTATMWLWHIPFLFDASLAPMEGFTLVPILHAGSMLLAGVLFSWPLFGLPSSARIHPLSGIVYLFTACISCSLLGLLITFAPAGIFHFHPAANMAMNSLPANPWNLSETTDQQAAGLIMWVPCCFVYLFGCLYLLRQWFATEEPEKLPEQPFSFTLLIEDHE